jgi:hypothetical protein
MDLHEMDQRIRNIDQRTTRIEQYLPSLGTKEELAATIAPLATKEELAAAIAPLATKAELAAAIAPLATKSSLDAAVERFATQVREEGDQTRHFVQVLFEDLRDRIQIIAEGHGSLQRQIDELRSEHDARLRKLEQRL